MKALEVILLHMISVIIQDAEELGCEVKTYHIEPECWLLCDKDAKKTIAIGLVPDLKSEDGRRKTIGAMQIKIKNYKWAMSEGFSHKDLIDKDNLNVLKTIPLHKVSKVLASK